MGELVDQSPSHSCSVVGTVPRLSNGRTSRPVPEPFVLGSRYSPQVIEWVNWSTSPRAYHVRYSPQVVVWANWSTSPQAYHARWSVQSLDISCPSDQRSYLCFVKKSYHHINVRCDRASCHLVSLLHKKGGLRIVHPLIAGIKKGNRQLLKNGHKIYCGSS